MTPEPAGVPARTGNRLLEAVAPARLGPGFRWLLSSSWVSNLGDGLMVSAGPLLVRAHTDDAVLVSTAALLSWLPYLLFGLVAGVVSDRYDRLRVIVATDVVRIAVLTVLALSVLTDAVSIGFVLAALFVLGIGDVFGNNAAGTLLPMLIAREELALGNARLQGGFIVANQLAGPSIGAVLFAAGAASPFVANAVLVALGVLCTVRIALPPHARPEPSRVGHDIAEGLRWVRRHAAVRTLVLTIFTFNITYGAAWSVLVLYATDRLRLGPAGYGLITTTIAAGGLVSTLFYGRLVAHVTLANLMRVGLVIETFTHLALALTRLPWVAMIIFFVFGAHAFVWGATSATVRQRAVPSELQGRVNSVNSIGTFGGLVVGAAIGGVLARHFGVTAPFWFAFAGSALFVVAIWSQLRHIAHADDDAGAHGPSGLPGSTA